ncbi:protein of unknown function [Denitratisoma oestradiolicum]|uniref:Electron transfer flavoprotein alpha/beta-subunit N-terminal domain-containing protein n=1 Tax=Denitratisoma oestradiolicum TaxID=311182 RepID=A0A6S6XWL5_9PROT|nr:protein of unknown function [Denitratisoma oestradiolicum]
MQGIRTMTVVLCTWGNTLEGGTEEALTLARQFAAANGAALNWVVIGPAANDAAQIAGQYGVASLDVISDAKLAGFGPDALVASLAQYCEQIKPTTVLFNQSAPARLIAPRLAGRLNVPVVMNTFALAQAGNTLSVTATAFGGDTHVVYQLAAPVKVISVVTTSLVAEAAATATTPARRDIAVDLSAVEERFKVTSAPRAEGPRLEDAEIIVSGGRGLASAANYDALVKPWPKPWAACGRLPCHRGRGLDRLLPPGGPDRQDHPPGPVSGGGHFRRQPAHGRLFRRQDHRRHQQGQGRLHLPLRPLRHRGGLPGCVARTDQGYQSLTRRKKHERTTRTRRTGAVYRRGRRQDFWQPLHQLQHALLPQGGGLPQSPLCRIEDGRHDLRWSGRDLELLGGGLPAAAAPQVRQALQVLRHRRGGSGLRSAPGGPDGGSRGEGAGGRPGGVGDRYPLPRGRQGVHLLEVQTGLKKTLAPLRPPPGGSSRLATLGYHGELSWEEGAVCASGACRFPPSWEMWRGGKAAISR